MENYLTPEFLEKYFAEYKSYMIWIMFLFSIVSIGLQYAQSLKLLKKVESYKNDLKKNEIKFSRFNELQIESLKKLYDQIVTFHFKYNYLINPSFYTHNTFITNLNNLKEEYNVCMEYFHRNKIFLPDNLINKIRDIDANFRLIGAHFVEELRSIREVEDFHQSNDVQIIYENWYIEIESIKGRVENLKSKTGVVDFESEIKSMRDLIEIYFKELVK